MAHHELADLPEEGGLLDGGLPLLETDSYEKIDITGILQAESYGKFSERKVLADLCKISEQTIQTKT